MTGPKLWMCNMVEDTLSEEHRIEDRLLLPMYYGPETFVTYDEDSEFGLIASENHHNNYQISEGLDFECGYILPDLPSS